MALEFPNPSRSFDASRKCVCFWGYDNTREVAFRVSAEVLSHLGQKVSSEEAALLAIFDEHRNEILKMAHDIYPLGNKSTYAIL